MNFFHDQLYKVIVESLSNHSFFKILFPNWDKQCYGVTICRNDKESGGTPPNHVLCAIWYERLAILSTNMVISFLFKSLFILSF